MAPLKSPNLLGFNVISLDHGLIAVHDQIHDQGGIVIADLIAVYYKQPRPKIIFPVVKSAIMLAPMLPFLQR